MQRETPFMTIDKRDHDVKVQKIINKDVNESYIDPGMVEEKLK